MDKSNDKNSKIVENKEIVDWLKGQSGVKSAREDYENNFDWLMHQGMDDQPSGSSSSQRNPIGQSPRKNPFTRDKGDNNFDWLMNLGSPSTTPAQKPSTSQSRASKPKDYENNFDWLMHQGESEADENQGAGLQGIGEIKPLTAGRNATEYQDEVEQELASMEAIYTGGLESLQTVFSQQIEEMGAIQLIQNIIDQAEDLSDSFNEEVIYIKDTVDLSDPQEVLTELVDSAETLLDDMQIENLTETLSSQLEGLGLGDEEEFEEEEYIEPEEEEYGELEEEEIPEENYEANEAVSGSGATLTPEEQSFLDSHESEVAGIQDLVDLIKFLHSYWDELNNISDMAATRIMIYFWYKMNGPKGFTIYAEGDSHSDSGWVAIWLNGWDDIDNMVDDPDLGGILLDFIDDLQTEGSIEVGGDYMFEQTKEDYSGPEEFFGEDDWQDEYKDEYMGNPTDNDGDGWPDDFADSYNWYDDFEDGSWFNEESILEEYLEGDYWKGLEPIIRDIFEHSKVEIHRENE